MDPFVRHGGPAEDLLHLRRPLTRGDQADGGAKRPAGRLDRAGARPGPLLPLRRIGGNMKLKRLAVGLAVAVPLAVVGLAYAAGVFGDARQATARFHHLPTAEAAGYQLFRDAQG